MIKAADIPHFTGEPEALETDAEGVKKDATAFRTTGAEIHKSFQGLSAFYEAPEAEALFASTQPVATQADDFADDLHDVGAALDTFASEVRPLKARLERLRTQAANFEASVEGEDDWQEDEDKVAKNNDLLHDVNSTVAALWAAERSAANKILRLVGKPTYKANDGSNKPGMYGYTGEQLDGAETPWGSAEEESHAWYEVDHWLAEGGRLAKEFVWDGVLVDGAGAALSGIGALVTLDGDAWSGLGDFFTGVGLYVFSPVDWALDHTLGPDEETAGEKRAKQTVVDFGKSMVAWDEWEKHPSKALGTTVFNGLTLGAGSLLKLGKAGEVASAGRTGALSKASEAATAAGKVGRVVDPMTHVFNGAGKLPKLRDVMQGIQHTDGFRMTGRADGSLHIAEDTFLHSDGTLRNGKGALLEGTVPRQEPSAADLTSRAPDETPAPRPDHELAHVGGDNTPANAHAQAGEGARSEPGAGSGTDALGDARGIPEEARHGTGGGSQGSNAGPGDSGAVGTGHGGDLPAQRGGSGAGGDGGGHPGGGGSSGPEEAVRRQVDRANTDPDWFEKHYRNNGYRKDTHASDELGIPLTQLVKDPRSGAWVAAHDAPAPIQPKYLDGDAAGTRHTAPPEHLSGLDDITAKRDSSISRDTAAHHQISEAKEAHSENPTAASERAVHEAETAHKPLHTAMTRDSEAFGEAVAERHAIPEHYPDATKLDIKGPASGNHQFDQVWRRADGSYVVVEAKSSKTTDLNARTLPSGWRASQGTKEYFKDILEQMRARGRKYPSELVLAKKLELALAEGKVDYVVVRGEPDAGKYGGYTMRRFNVS